jgi:ABC-type transport system substrate-binding protein
VVRFEDYFDQTIRTNLDRIIFRTIRDPAALKTAFMNREVDLIHNVIPLDARELEDQGATILTTAGYFGYHYLAFNWNSPRVGQVNADDTPNRSGTFSLDDNSARLRMAIAYSINTRDIVYSPDIMDGRGIVSRQYIETLPFGRINDPTGTRLMFGDDFTGYYNPDRARELFNSLPASYRQPGSLRLTALAGSVFVRQALVIKDQVRRILGVDLIEIEQVALAELSARRGASDPNVYDLLVNWTFTDDSYFIFLAFDVNNSGITQDTKYFNREAQNWIESGNALPNGPDRDVAYRNANKIILNDLPRLPLVAMLGLSASQANVLGVGKSPSGSLRLTDAIKN